MDSGFSGDAECREKVNVFSFSGNISQGLNKGGKTTAYSWHYPNNKIHYFTDESLRASGSQYEP